MDDFWDGHYYKHHSDAQQSIASAMLEKFPLKGNECILDIGCGPGTISRLMADRVPEGKVIGIDPSMQMLSQAIRDYKAVSNLKFFCRKAESFQFDQKFHVITSFHALHFVKNHKQVFERIKSALKPKGRLLISMGSERDPDLIEILNRPRGKKDFCSQDRFFPLSLDEARSILQPLGFTLIRADVGSTPYLFSSLEKLEKWLIGWLAHASGLSDAPLAELAKEVAEYFCRKENRRVDIPVCRNQLSVEAHL